MVHICCRGFKTIRIVAIVGESILGYIRIFMRKDVKKNDILDLCYINSNRSDRVAYML